MEKKYNLNVEWQIKNNPAFCTMPFTHQYIATDGFVNLCCLADYNFPIVKNVQGHDLQEVWESEDMQEVRKTMLEGKFEKRCTTCWKQDKQGGGSDRESLNEVYLKYRLKKNPDLRLDIEKGNNTGGPTWADYRPGRLCNFGCRMCFGAISSTIAKEQQQHPETQEIMNEEWKDVQDWIDDPVCFESVKKHIPKMASIKLAGGEPLFMPGVYKLLKWCVESGNTHLMLDITTNGSRLKSKTTNLLPKFRQVDLQFSMCGIGYANDYIRYGANWNELDKAYQHYLKMPVTVQLLATAQIYNAWDLPKLVDYWYKHGKSTNIVFNPVNGPIDLMIDLIPFSYKIEIAEELKSRLHLLTDEQLRISRLPHVIARLELPDPVDLETIDKYKNWRTHFVRRTITYDRIRNQDVTKIHPKLTEIWNKWYKEYGD